VPVEYWHLFRAASRAASRQKFDAKAPQEWGVTRSPSVNEEQSKKAVFSRPLEGAHRGGGLVGHDQGAQAERRSALQSRASCSRRRAFPVKKTMMLAQQLYEGVETAGARRRWTDWSHYLHANRFGPCGPDEGRRRGARTHQVGVRPRVRARHTERVQVRRPMRRDAHEAIRPDPRCSTIRKTVRAVPDTGPSTRCTGLIWNRFCRPSQMPPADVRRNDRRYISAGDYLFRVKGTVPKVCGPGRRPTASRPASPNRRSPRRESEGRRR